MRTRTRPRLLRSLTPFGLAGLAALTLISGCDRAYHGGSPDGGLPDGAILPDGAVRCEQLDPESCERYPGCEVYRGCQTECYGPTPVYCDREGLGQVDCAAPYCPPTDCESLDEATCKNTSPCQVFGCPDCDGKVTFISCYDPARPPPPVACAQPYCPGSCEGLDEKSCDARPDCIGFGCAACDGSSSGFIGCYDRDAPPPPVACEPCGPDCYSLDVKSCSARSDCQVHTCNGCFGETFTRCGYPDEPQACPGVACPPDECTGRDEASCNGAAQCHSVYREGPELCECDGPGCCTFFERCAPGPARCQPGAVLCDALPPTCEGPYTVAYTDDCYEGCVRSDACPQP